MPRGISTALANALAASELRPILFVELEYAGTTLNLCDQGRDVDWNSKTWLGNGMLREVKGINDTDDLMATGAVISLSGVNPAILATVLNSTKQSDQGAVWYGALDSNYAVIDAPVEIFRGYADVPVFTDSGESSTLDISYESEFSILDKSSELRFTSETLQRFFPGDLGMEYVSQVSRIKPFWGKAPKAPPVKKRQNVTQKPKGNSGGRKK